MTKLADIPVVIYENGELTGLWQPSECEELVRLSQAREVVAALTARLEDAQRERDTALTTLALDLKVEKWDPPLVAWAKTPNELCRAMALNMAKSRDELKHANRALKAAKEAAEQQLTEAQRENQSMRAVLFRLTTAQGYHGLDGSYCHRSTDQTWYCDPAVFCVPCIAQRALDEVAKESK